MSKRTLRLSGIRVGDILQSHSEGATCIPPNRRFVVHEDEKGLWIACWCGRHYIDGEVAFDEPDRVVGLSRAVPA